MGMQSRNVMHFYRVAATVGDKPVMLSEIHSLEEVQLAVQGLPPEAMLQVNEVTVLFGGERKLWRSVQ